MADPAQLIEYLRRCYEADNRETGITNLMHEKNRHVRFFDGEELAAHGTVPLIPLPREFAEEVRKDAFNARRDKSLIYAVFPILGGLPSKVKLRGAKSGRKFCAPIVFFPSEISESQGSLFLQPDLHDSRINFPALNALSAAGGGDSDTLESFLLDLPELPWSRAQVHTLAASLAGIFPNIDFSALASFPHLYSGPEIADALKSGRSTLRCLPAAAMALLPNSPDTRGVLFELSELSAFRQPSAAMKSLLADTRSEASSPTFSSEALLATPKHFKSFAPSILSHSQQAVVHSSRTHPLSLVIGPPGTGKSYTIASIALDHLARNQTVLIASRMDQAVNVVADKMEELLGPTHNIVRAGRKEHMREMRKSLEDLLQGLITVGPESSPRTLRKQLKQLDKQIANTELALQNQLRREATWGSLEATPMVGWLDGLTRGLRKGLHTWRLHGSDAWQTMLTYNQLLSARNELSRRTLRAMVNHRMQRLLKRKRDHLSKFLQAIRARSDGRQQKLFQEVDFSVLLSAFPVWLCKLADLANVLPLRPGLFDLVILDEATQCDIASCLPLLQRGRRAVVVGDPKQLRHISFLSTSRQEAIASECQLSAAQRAQFSFRSESILDTASDRITQQSRVTFLNEHYRSLPSIIEFSNREFYSGALSIMRQRPHSANTQEVQLRPIEGQRTANGRNQIEAEAVLSEVLKQIKQQPQGPHQRCQTIGVLSPLREQADLLSSLLRDHLTFDQLKNYDVLIGTAHTFQGEERDVMFISLAADDDSHWSTFRFLNTPNVLNVAITRARERQYVFHSFDPRKLETESLLRRYLASMREIQPMDKTQHRHVDRFRDELLSALAEDGLQVWKDYAVAGVSLDIVLESSQRAIGIDLVGYPGALAQAFPLERYRMLDRAGLAVFPLSYRAWKMSPEACIATIRKQLA